MTRILQNFTPKKFAQKIHNFTNITIPLIKKQITYTKTNDTVVCLDTRGEIQKPWYEMLAHSNQQYNYIFLYSERGILATDTVATAVERIITTSQSIKILCINISSIFKTERIDIDKHTNHHVYSSVHTFFPYHNNSTNLFLHFYTFVKNINYIETLCKIHKINLIWHCNTEIITTFVIKQFINKKCFVGKQVGMYCEEKLFKLFNRKF